MQPTTGGFVGIISCWVFGEGRVGGGLENQEKKRQCRINNPHKVSIPVALFRI